MTMKNSKYRAYSYDLLHWRAEIWIDYSGYYEHISCSPIFNNPEDAVKWAKNNFNQPRSK